MLLPKDRDWTDIMGFIVGCAIVIGISIAITQSPGCVIEAERERTKRLQPIININPCGEEL